MDLLMEKLKKRSLTVLGVFLLLIAVDGLVRNEITMVNEAPQMGSLIQLPAEQSNTLTAVVAKLNNMPFLISGLLGGMFIVLDARNYAKEKSVFKHY